MASAKTPPNGGRERTTDGIFYTLYYKSVKNLNLRVRADGSVALSAPRRCTLREADAFVSSHAAWIARARESARARRPQDIVPGEIDRDAALALFLDVMARYYGDFCFFLDEMPRLTIRDMRTRWGVCNVSRRRITLNLRLAGMPREALEYVVVHEYAHFLHPNHGPLFWAEVARVLPDWKQRRALLRG